MMFISLNSAYMCIAQNRDKAQKRGISVPKVLPKPIIWWRGLKRSHITPDPSHRTLSIDIDNHPAIGPLTLKFLAVEFYNQH